MTAQLHWQTEGQGSDLLLIHGWGMNGAVWQQVLPVLAQHYRVHVVDLPGYGHSRHHPAADVDEMADMLLAQAPAQATWLGWSLGGLVATAAALQAPGRVQQLVTVASSPRFAAEETWRGIKPQVLDEFRRQLDLDFRATIERFMALQAMGSRTARQDIRQLKEAVLSRPEPNPAALALGLDILARVDLRPELAAVSPPWLRLYGRLDSLVPAKVARDLDQLAPQSQRHVFAGASHAPFISHPDEFIDTLKAFTG
ncbi:pimeloyl-[acyl-carrier protein] methyl ester esterase [Photobacterium gaetbulicola]|uniref:Pimeloyl-[acyl-carrier protein] methyl ester esterase n=1 Tax=Photobacterium gaetbulicola Gung47 TaxID=658445 RepID=A0A0C5WVQ7_9GAMM|nr:pimeloyl-ACP methyl ester esterase BioH [Photobacterium gaetbulicola]AJR07180.1 putative bioH protein [Photobacterium gaetbulicola Gung47]PSU13780.1 pimeloyl-[acyl-carrier protein] methyl ester esterase [Photobacterium gaetbulicola]